MPDFQDLRRFLLFYGIFSDEKIINEQMFENKKARLYSPYSPASQTYSAKYRYMNVMICSLRQSLFGPNVVSLVPEVMPSL